MSTEPNSSQPDWLGLKPIRKEGIEQALDKVKQYRLLNEPLEAESICRDILAIEPDNQNAIIQFVLTLSDRLVESTSAKEANLMIPKIQGKYEQQYYKALILERQGKAALVKGYPGCRFDAFEWLEEAMYEFEAADKLCDPENNDAILRRNTCVRIITDRKLGPRPVDVQQELLD